jgi:hypothetical protein
LHEGWRATKKMLWGSPENKEVPQECAMRRVEKWTAKK